MKSIFAVALLGGAVLGGAAFAQSTQPADRAAPAVTSQPVDAKMALKANWRASKLMGQRRGHRHWRVMGMGEHDIAVSMDKLRFVEEPVRSSSTTASTTTRDTTTGASTAPANTTTRNANDWTPDHAVMSGNKDQLKALPQFKYSDYN
jgi:hypothetical protein